MPTSDKTVKVTLIAVAAPYAKGMAEASVATRKLGTDIDRASSKTKGLETGAGRASGALKGMAIGAGALAATGLVAFLKDAVKGASDLGETTAKVGQIFGQEALPALEKFANGAADSLGQSKQQALDAAATFGIFGKSAGKTGDDLVGFSTQMVQLAGDLASFANTSPEDAITAIGAALRGESEPIRQYGILLDDASLRQRALKLGIIQTTKQALTPQQRVLAAQAEILAQTSDAQGDFARTSNGLANQQRILSAEWANAKTELGEGLLPAVTETVKALRGGVNVAVAAGHAFNEIPGPVKAAIAALVIYKLTNDRVATGVAGARNAIQRMRDELALQKALAGGISGGYQKLGDEAQTAGTKVSRTAVGLGVASKAARGAGSALLGAFGGPVGIAITGLTLAIGAFAAKHQEAQQRVEDFTAAIKADSGALGENTREAAANALEKSGAAKAARDLGVNLADLTSAALGQADAQERVNEALARAQLASTVAGNSLGEMTAASQTFNTNAAKVRDAIGGTNSELSDATAEYQRHAELVGKDSTVQQDYGTVVEATTAKVVDQAAAVRDAAQAVLDSVAAKASAYDAEINYQKALDDTAKAIKDNGKTSKDHGKELDLNTEKGRENASALLDLANAVKAKSEADIKGGASLKSVRDGMKDAREEFVKNAEKAGLSKAAAEKMATQFGLTKGTVDNLARSVKDLPASKQIKIEAEAAAAKVELARLHTLLDGIKSKSVVVDVVTNQRYANRGTKRDGSHSTAGGIDAGVYPAGGGHITGPGTATSDSIPAWLSNGEYVVKAAAVAKYGVGFLSQVNAMRFAEGGAVRYGSRAQVTSMPSAGPASITETNNAPLIINGGQFGPTIDDIRREEARERRRNALSPSRG